MRKKIEGDWAVHWRLIQAAKVYWWMFVIGLLGTMGLSMADAGFTWLIKPIINEGFVAKNFHFIRCLPIIIVIIFLLRGLSGFLSNYYINLVARNVVRDFRRQLFNQLMHLPSSYYDQHSPGYLLST